LNLTFDLYRSTLEGLETDAKAGAKECNQLEQELDKRESEDQKELKEKINGDAGGVKGPISRGIHGLPKVLLEPAMPYNSTAGWRG
jgi:hypothetical protein